jgi:hypothetical protein
MLDTLSSLFTTVHAWLFEALVQPVLYQLGFMAYAEQAFSTLEVSLYGVLEIGLMLLLLRPLEWWRPVERWPDRRAVRVIVDVGMHVQRMDFDTAVNLMVEHAKLERPSAESEVRRYTQTPTQPLSYLMGMLMIKQLREDYHKKKGDAFQISDFHDRLLGYGSIPLKTIRESMLK